MPTVEEEAPLVVHAAELDTIKMAAQEGPGRGKAKQIISFDLAELYLHAAEVHKRFGKTMKSIGEATGAKTEIAPLKRISRILEKISH